MEGMTCRKSRLTERDDRLHTQIWINSFSVLRKFPVHEKNLHNTKKNRYFTITRWPARWPDGPCSAFINEKMKEKKCMCLRARPALGAVVDRVALRDWL